MINNVYLRCCQCSYKDDHLHGIILLNLKTQEIEGLMAALEVSSINHERVILELENRREVWSRSTTTLQSRDAELQPNMCIHDFQKHVQKHVHSMMDSIFFCMHFIHTNGSECIVADCCERWSNHVECHMFGPLKSSVPSPPLIFKITKPR